MSLCPSHAYIYICYVDVLLNTHFNILTICLLWFIFVTLTLLFHLIDYLRNYGVVVIHKSENIYVGSVVRWHDLSWALMSRLMPSPNSLIHLSSHRFDPSVSQILTTTPLFVISFNFQTKVVFALYCKALIL